MTDRRKRQLQNEEEKENLIALAKQIFQPVPEFGELRITCPPEYQHDSVVETCYINSFELHEIEDRKIPDPREGFEITFSGSIAQLFPDAKLTATLVPLYNPDKSLSYEGILYQIPMSFKGAKLDVMIHITEKYERELVDDPAYRQNMQYVLEHESKYHIDLGLTKISYFIRTEGWPDRNEHEEFLKRFYISFNRFQKFGALGLPNLCVKLFNSYEVFFSIDFTLNKTLYIKYLYINSERLNISLKEHKPFLYRQSLGDPDTDITIRELVIKSEYFENFFTPAGAYIENILLDAVLPIPGIEDKDSLINHIQVKFNEDELKKLLAGKKRQELYQYHNIYKSLLSAPYHAHQRDEIHRYIAYFQAKTGQWLRRAIFWITGDYYRIERPFWLGLNLYLLFLIVYLCLGAGKVTVPFYGALAAVGSIINSQKEVCSIINLQGSVTTKVLTILGVGILNLVRWVLEISIGYCILSVGIAFKKRFGMGNPKDYIPR